jgi:galactokinase
MLDELSHFGERLLTFERRDARLSGFFDGVDEVALARAPGRLDVMGGFADYSGSLVLELPLSEAARVAVARTDDARVRVASVGRVTRMVDFAASELFAACGSFESLRRYFADQRREDAWAAYVLGGLPWLSSHGVALEGGLRMLLDSSVPEGAGVSSSAAIEVAALAALSNLAQVSLTGPELGLVCQAVENRVVGAACGAMDQLTSACGERDRLLALWCQPAVLRGQLPLPEGLAVFGLDSGVRHSVAGAAYTDVRVAAFMGLCIVAKHLGARVLPTEPGTVVLEDDPLRGYLANLPLATIDERLLAALPERMVGAEFLARFGGIPDRATRVDAKRDYRVRAATLHPVYEHARAEQLAAALAEGPRESDFRQLAGLMQASHDSYSACGLGSLATDRLVAAVQRRLPEGRLFGARITGGGSGGTVAILARADALDDVVELATEQGESAGRTLGVFSGSSSGTLAFPARRQPLKRSAHTGAQQ